MRRTKEEAQLTREDILSAALEVFSQDGYAATRLEDIAEKAAVTRGAIYHHFASKEDLYKALVTERSAGINQLAAEIMSQEGSSIEILRGLLVGLFEYAEQHQEYRALLELGINKVEYTEGLESIWKDTLMGRRQLAGFFERTLERGIQAGEIRADLPAGAAAWALVSYMNGVGLIWVQDSEAFSLGEQAEALANTFLKGIEA